ncbi:MAG TPA: hypothetical protein VMU81_20750 [Acetobacteraceae bacterium]|nr:hypothetical protein [Acetobacteraceae bacterium]
MTGKLTTYDPAEDLTSDAAVATFTQDAFATLKTRALLPMHLGS